MDPNNEFYDGDQDNDKDGFLDVWRKAVWQTSEKMIKD